VTFPITFPFGTPPYRHQAEREGRLFVHGLKLEADERDRAVVQEVEPGSLAERHGIQPGQRVAAIVVSPASKGEQVEELLGTVQARGEASVRSKATVINPSLSKAYGALFDADGRKNHDRVTLSLVGDAGRRIASWDVSAPDLPRSRPVQPTQIYDAVSFGLMCLFAWLYFPFRRRDGEVFALMLMIAPISRFFIEWVRTDEPGTFFRPLIAAVTGHDIGLTISQAIAVGLFLSSFAFWWWVLRKPKDSKLTPADWAPLNARWAQAST
jgi:phosphatidylglycerol:prolipoprotein diacylglycerol transferase